MFNEKRFYENLEQWTSCDSTLAVLLPDTNSDHLMFTKTRCGELNLKGTLQNKTFYFHSTINAKKQTETWFKNLNLENKEILYIYGLGLGYAYDAANHWVHQQKNRWLTFLEDDPAVIFCFLQTPHAAKILRDEKVKIIFFDDPEKSRSLADLYWETQTEKIEVSCLPCYGKMKAEIYEKLRLRLPFDASLRKRNATEFLSYGDPYFLNFYPNLLSLSDAYSAQYLFGKFKNIPAIICGAGPSLNKQLPILSQLQHQALIFSGGSALNALAKANITPHFGAGIDPNDEQYLRLLNTRHLQIPFFYRNRIYFKALREVKGPQLYVAGGGGYNTAKWFEDALKIRNEEITEELDEGHNVVNFCLDIARCLGCNPIVFVGLDLAYTHSKTYADGVLQDSNLKKDEKQEELILRQDIEGHPVYTEWKWIAESVWITEFAEKYPELLILNATEGGIGMKGISNCSFQSVKDEYLKKSIDLDKKVAKLIQDAAFQNVNLEKIIQLMMEFSESLQRCQKNILVLLQEIQKVKSEAEKAKNIPGERETGIAALAEYQLIEEPGYLYLLEIFNKVYIKVTSRATFREDASSYKSFISQLNLQINRLSFLYNVANSNCAIIKFTLSDNFMHK